MTDRMPEAWVVCWPAPALRPWIDRYVGYRLLGGPAGVHRGLPSRHMTFIVSIGSPIDVIAQTSPTQRPAAYRCVLSGLQASFALIAHDGNQEGVAIELTPLGSRALFGLPARELWDLSLELDEVVGSVGDELWDRLQSTRTWQERFSVCDEVLQRLAGPRAPAPELMACWRALVHSGGQMNISELAERTGWSRQYLGRRFREEFGLSPKLLSRVIRFERAGNLLKAPSSLGSIAEIAASCGYYDQAHLHRDVIEFSGCTPSELSADIGGLPESEESSPAQTSQFTVSVRA